MSEQFPEIVFWFLLLFSLLCHFIFCYKSPYGHILYFDYGFAIVAVSGFILGVVCYYVTFPIGKNIDMCASPVGYCSTISCISGNIYYQGYVFMFVIFCFNASIGFRALSEVADNYPVKTEPGSKGSKEGEVVKYRKQKKVKKHPLFFQACEWNHNVRVILRIGLLLTTFTGIMPTVAYDNSSLSPLAVAIANGHVVGIVVGSGLILLSLTANTGRRIINEAKSCREIDEDTKLEEYHLQSDVTHPKNYQSKIVTRIEYIIDLILVIITVTMIVCFFFGILKCS
jgi:hypothetical protein